MKGEERIIAKLKTELEKLEAGIEKMQEEKERLKSAINALEGNKK